MQNVPLIPGATTGIKIAVLDREIGEVKIACHAIGERECIHELKVAADSEIMASLALDFPEDVCIYLLPWLCVPCDVPATRRYRRIALVGDTLSIIGYLNKMAGTEDDAPAPRRLILPN